MEHIMNLNKKPFEKIRDGRKVIELRLYDEKRRKIAVGDTIVFNNREEDVEPLKVKVTGLLNYISFRALINDFPMGYFAKGADYGKEELINGMYQYYTKDEEEKYGVLGIRLELI